MFWNVKHLVSSKGTYDLYDLKCVFVLKIICWHLFSQSYFLIINTLIGIDYKNATKF